MKLSAILQPLVDAGVDAPTILKAVKAWEDQQSDALERRRANDRERQERRRHVKSRDVTVTVSSHEAGDTRGEDNLQTKNSTGQKENKKEAAPKALSDLSAFKANLEQDATAEQVEAFAKHRKAKNGQNSAYAAKLFRKDAAACGLSVSDAIDTAISRGWLTVKPEYLAGRQPPKPQATAPPGKPRTVAELAIHRLETGQTRYEPPDEPDRHMGEGGRPGQAQGPGVLELVAIAAHGYRRTQ